MLVCIKKPLVTPIKNDNVRIGQSWVVVAVEGSIAFSQVGCKRWASKLAEFAVEYKQGAQQRSFTGGNRDRHPGKKLLL